MALVAGLDFGGGAVKACVARVEDGAVLALAEQPTQTVHPAPGRAEFEPQAWWSAACTAMREAVARAGRRASEYAGITATSLRQGYVLLDEAEEIGRGVLNSDRRGEEQLERVRGVLGPGRLYSLTGHWSAPQLTLPKLLAEQAAATDRWGRTRTMLFVHDWALWRLSGVRVSEPSMGSAGQLLDVRSRSWADELITALGLDPGLLPPLRDAGTVAGELRDAGLGLPVGLPVIVGGGDTQMAAAGAGGLRTGVVTVVAGTTTPLQAASDTVPTDPERHPWVSAHLQPGAWAVETNAGYTGMSFDWLAGLASVGVDELAAEAESSPPGADGISAVVTSRIWSEASWSERAPAALVGFEPRHRRADVARAFLEAHAYGIRGNLEDLERSLDRPARATRLLGGAARSTSFSQLVADVCARPIQRVLSEYPAGRGFAMLAAGQVGERDIEDPPIETFEPADPGAYEEGYMRFVDAGDAVRRELSGWTA